MKYIVATNCGGVGLGTLASYTGTGSTAAWALFTHTYTPTHTAPMLTFISTDGGADITYLDGVSVVENGVGVELLTNPSFEDSTSTPTGWTTWNWCGCSASGITSGSTITTGGTCHTGSGSNCLHDHCKSGYDFIGQTFNATIGQTYTISYWLSLVVGPAGKLYVDATG